MQYNAMTEGYTRVSLCTSRLPRKLLTTSRLIVFFMVFSIVLPSLRKRCIFLPDLLTFFRTFHLNSCMDLPAIMTFTSRHISDS